VSERQCWRFASRLNALKARRTIVGTHVDGVQEQYIEVDIHVQRTTQTLNQCYGPGRASHAKKVQCNRASRDTTVAEKLWGLSVDMTGVNLGI
jgi:hypothetical protein